MRRLQLRDKWSAPTLQSIVSFPLQNTVLNKSRNKFTERPLCPALRAAHSGCRNGGNMVYFTVRRIRSLPPGGQRRKYRIPTYTTTRQANIKATGSRGFASDPGLADFCRGAGGRLKAVTLSVTCPVECALTSGGTPMPPISA